MTDFITVAISSFGFRVKTPKPKRKPKGFEVESAGLSGQNSVAKFSILNSTP